jgi:hypothetical protein
MCPRDGMDNLEKSKVPGIEPESFCCPARSLVAIPDRDATVTNLSSGAGTVQCFTLWSQYRGTMPHRTANSKVTYQ